MRPIFQWLFYHSAYGLTFLRIVLGAIFLYTGYFKFFHMGSAVYYFTSKGFPIPEIIGPLVSGVELIGGALLLAGAFTRYLGLIFAGEFLVATLFIAISKGLVLARFEFMVLTACIVLATQGAGRFAVDRPGRPWEPFSDRRRRQERWKWQGEAVMSLPHEAQGKLININQTGVSVADVDGKVDLNMPVELEIMLSDIQFAEGPLKLKGKVRWIEDKGEKSNIGIQFDQPDPRLSQLFQKNEGE